MYALRPSSEGTASRLSLAFFPAIRGMPTFMAGLDNVVLLQSA
jgi:hypothetical protein